MAEPAPPPGRARRRGALALAMLSTLASLLAAEVIVRFTYPQPPGFGYLSDAGIPIHIPSASGAYRRLEFEAPVSFNSLGFRDAEFIVPKPRGAFRILALGDSFTEALQVPDEESYPTMIERLAAQRGMRVDVANLGVSGYGTDDALRLLQAYGTRLEPDLAVLFFCLDNDARNNLFEGFCRLEGGRLACAPPPPPGALRRALRDLRSYAARRSQLYQLARGGLHALLGDADERPPRPGEPGYRLGFEGELFLVPEPARVTEALELTRALLAALRQAAASMGADTWVVLLPTQRQVDDATWRAFVDGNPGRVLVRTRPQERMKEIAAAAGIHVIDLYPAMRGLAESGRSPYWQYDAHFSPPGHRAAAEVVAEQLVARRGAPPRPEDP